MPNEIAFYRYEAIHFTVHESRDKAEQRLRWCLPLHIIIVRLSVDYTSIQACVSNDTREKRVHSHFLPESHSKDVFNIFFKCIWDSWIKIRGFENYMPMYLGDLWDTMS